MKTFKTTIIIPVLFLVVLGIHPTLQAQLVSELDNVNFYLHDLDPDDSAGVTLTANTFSSDSNEKLWFSKDGGVTYDLISGSANIENELFEDGKAQIFLQLRNEGESLNTDTDGVVTFLGGPDDAGLYRGLSVSWKDFDPSDPAFAYTFSVSNGRFSPVPIPPAALLLLSGIAGLIGFRKIMPK